jgi:hypothetical protein
VCTGHAILTAIMPQVASLSTKMVLRRIILNFTVLSVMPSSLFHSNFACDLLKIIYREAKKYFE